MAKTRLQLAQSKSTSIHIHNPVTLNTNVSLSTNLNSIFLSLEKDKNKNTKIKSFNENQNYQTHNVIISFSLNIARYKNKKNNYSYAVYSRNDLIGKGSCGYVYKVMGKLKHENGRLIYSHIDPNNEEKQRAIKCQLVGDEAEKNIQKNENEIQRLFPDFHTRPISFIRENGQVVSSEIVMQKLPGNELFDSLFLDYTSIERLQISFNLVFDLNEIHATGVIHNDYKPENVMFQKGIQMKCKAIDFGFSRKIGTVLSHPSGTPQYLAPEMTVDFKKTDERIDIYALGIVLKLLWQDDIQLDEMNDETRDLPSLLRHLEQLWNKEIYPDIQIPLPIKNLNKLTDLLKHLTAPRAEYRPSLKNALLCLYELAYEELQQVFLENRNNRLHEKLMEVIKKAVTENFDINKLPIYMNMVVATAKYFEAPNAPETQHFLKESCIQLSEVAKDSAASNLIKVIESSPSTRAHGVFSSPSKKKRNINDAFENVDQPNVKRHCS